MNKDWFIVRAREIPAIWPLISYWNWDVSGETGLKDWTVYHVWQCDNYHGVLDPHISPYLANFYYKRITEDETFVDTIRPRAAKVGDAVLEICRDFSKRSETGSLEEYIEFLSKLRAGYAEFIKENMFYWIYAPELIKTRIDELLKDLSGDDRQQIDTVLSVPEEKSYSYKIDQVLRSIVDAKSRGENVSEQIDSFVKEYIWFPYEYTGPALYDKKTVEGLLDSISKETEDSDKDIVDRGEVVKQYSVPDEVVKLYKILNVLTLLQDDRKANLAHVCYLVNDIIFEHLGKRLSVSKKLSRYVDEGLLSNCIADSDFDIKTELARRYDLFAIKQTSYKQEQFIGDEVIEQLSKDGIDLLDKKSDISELKGQVSFRGIAKGKARIVRNSGTYEGFREGDILVAPMTTPDYIHLIKMASAIVTDEGGITCHAAIVARELKKPCLIGTKFATQTFNDGDDVEVDADNGVVRILNKADD